MSNKEIVTDLLLRVPDDASLTEITRVIECVAAEGRGELAEESRLARECANRSPAEEVTLAEEGFALTRG